ncbi:MAG: hypothetical protein R3E57_04645 [Porticoccaceae bacterium]
MKIIRKFVLPLILTVLSSSSAYAYLAGPLPADTYVQANGLDWTWASPWGTIYEGTKFAAPTAHEGWRYATVTELEYLFNNLVDVFLNGGSPIQSVLYWDLDGTSTHVDTGDLIGGYIMSGDNYFNDSCFNNVCEVFYVRGGDIGNSIPAPGTLTLLCIGLLAFGLTTRKMSRQN